MSDFKKIGIIGLGLIGGSLAFEIKKRKIADKVIGFSSKIKTMEKALREGIIDEFYDCPEKLIENTDFLILSTPISALYNYIKIIKVTNPKIFFTDVASVKKVICENVEKIIGENSNFVGSHPIAGSEKSGIENIKDGLFENKIVIITPTKNTNKNVKKKVKLLWEKLGSKVYIMDPEQHDKILGFTSHLPHLLIYTLLSVGEKNKEILKKFFGSGFFDTTRIGKSNPEMWTDIFLENKINILDWTKKFEDEINKLKIILKRNEREKLYKFLKRAKIFRESLE
ncbi:MAG: prephenate dehydrogenase [bacterium]|nr:prephenate dehydrogenase [bacterium]MDW8164392.1 prephenate dehydrogenase [Candidatus Omnitrophota bacterium]